MKREPNSGDIEKDPVWELLRESAAHRPGPNFAANVVRAARLEGQAKPWWNKILIPASIGGALAAAAAMVAVVMSLQTATPDQGSPKVAKVVFNEGTDSSFADLQENLETEVFLAASEQLGDYSDEELVSMIGF
jgi:hypothetical protein